MQQDPRNKPNAPKNRIPRSAQPTDRPVQQQSPYRSAAPYTVPPRTGTQRAPYPPSEMRRRQMLRKKRRRKRIALLITAVVICLLLIATLITAAVYAIRAASAWNTKSPADTDANAGMSDITTQTEDGTTLPPTPIETEPPLPAYDVPNMVTGTPLRPVWSDSTVLLSDTVSCTHAILINADTGAVIADKNAQEIIFPASMTKLMTLLVAYESISDLNATFRMTQDIIDPLYLDGLSLAGFAGGEEILIRDLLYGCALPSGAEASIGLAIASCGSEEAFVARMNDRAKLLGMDNTHFENCTGTHHDNHVSTLYDIGILIAYMMQNETLAEVIGTYQYTTTPTVQHPEGLLLTSTVYSRMRGNESGTCTVLGGKTGYTVSAGQCLATYAQNPVTGNNYACITAGGETKWRPVYDTIYLYQYYAAETLPLTPPPSIVPEE